MSMDLNVSNVRIKEELRKQWTDQAVKLALMGRWDEAIQANLNILKIFPDDIPARNRLGKAYFELGRYEEAIKAYEQTLRQQPSNNVARKRLEELYPLVNMDPTTALKNVLGLKIVEEEEEIETEMDEDSTD